LTIELTPAQGAESLRSCSKSILIFRLEISGTLTRCRSFLLKNTLLTFEHFPSHRNPSRDRSGKPKCARPCINSIRFSIYDPDYSESQLTELYWFYPINFIVKEPDDTSFSKYLSPEAWKPVEWLNLINHPTSASGSIP
jgi:hypothetical protein